MPVPSRMIKIRFPTFGFGQELNLLPQKGFHGRLQDSPPYYVFEMANLSNLMKTWPENQKVP